MTIMPCRENWVKTTHKPNYQQMFDYSKADVLAMKRELLAINWQKSFSNMTVEECFVDFKDLIEALKWKHVPITCRETNEFG